MQDSKDSKGMTPETAKALQKELQQSIRAIVEDPPYVAPPPSKAQFFTHLYEIIPLAGGFFTDIANSMKDIIKGEGMGQLIHLTTRIPPELVDMARGLPYVGMSSHIFNLARMGILWLGAKQCGIQLPFTFSKKAKTAYSLTALTLSILIIVFAASNPFVAGALAVAAASLGLVVAMTTLVRTYWLRSKERIELKKLIPIVDGLESRLSEIKKDLKAREKILQKALEDQRYDIITEQARAIERQKINYETLHKALEIAGSRKRLLEDKPKKKGRFFDKHLAIPLALVALIGAIIALSNPFVGLAIIGTGSLVGISIVLTFYVIVPFTNWIFQKGKNVFNRAANKEQESLAVAEKLIHDNAIQALPKEAMVGESLQTASPLTPLFEHAHPEPGIEVPVEELARRKALIEEDSRKQKEEYDVIEDMFSKMDKIKMPPATTLFEKEPRVVDEDEDEGDSDSDKEGNKPKVGKHG